MPEQDLCPCLQQCQKKTAHWSGVWRVTPQRAISLMPRKPSQILIVQGRAWITWEASVGFPPAPGADQFLASGESMDVPAGVHLVMESVDPGQVLDFDWRTMPAGLQAMPQPALSLLVRLWGRAWVQLALTSVQLLQGLVQHGQRSRRLSGPHGCGV